MNKEVLEIAEAPSSVSTRKNFDTLSEHVITNSKHKQLKARENNKQKRTANIGAYSHIVSTNQPQTRYTYPANQYDKIKFGEMSHFHFASVREGRPDKNIFDEGVEPPENIYHTPQLIEKSQNASSGQESSNIITENTVQTGAGKRESCHSIKSGKEPFSYTLTKNESDDEIDQDVSMDSDESRREDFNKCVN